MTTHKPTSRPSDCATLAPLLALRATGALDEPESARVERHLATCAACQADAALDDALAGDLRVALLAPVSAAPALTLDDILRSARQPDRASATLADSVIPPSPPMRSAPPRPGARHWRSGLTAIGVALAIVFFAVYVFGSMPRIGGVAQVRPAATLSPLLGQQTVYLGTETGIYALRASDRSLRWEYPPASALELRKHPAGVVSLALDGETLYALASSPDNLPYPTAMLLALDAHTGDARWSVTIPELSMASLLQVGNVLLVIPVVNSHVFIGADWITHTVLAFSAANGKHLWSRDLPAWPVSAPAAAGGALYVATGAQLIALDVASGAIRWSTPIVPSASQQGTTPAPYNDSVALTAAGPYVFALASRVILTQQSDSSEANLYEIAAADGTHIWRIGFEQAQSSLESAPAVSGNQVFAPVSSGLTAFSTGYSPPSQWRFMPGDAPGGDSMMAATYAGGVVYVTNTFSAQDGGITYSRSATYALRASDGAQLWRSQTYASGSGAGPVVRSGIVFTTSYGALLALRAANGQRLWKYPASSGAVGGIYVLQFG